jgi:hypothetical protein
LKGDRLPQLRIFFKRTLDVALEFFFLDDYPQIMISCQRRDKPQPTPGSEPLYGLHAYAEIRIFSRPLSANAVSTRPAVGNIEVRRVLPHAQSAITPIDAQVIYCQARLTGNFSG